MNIVIKNTHYYQIYKNKSENYTEIKIVILKLYHYIIG